jgi:hypothetical protein
LDHDFLYGVYYYDGAVGGSQGSGYFSCEVYVSGCVYEVDDVGCAVFFV